MTLMSEITPESITDFESRISYLRGEGFAFLSSTNARFLEALAERPIPAVAEGEAKTIFPGSYGIKHLFENNPSLAMHHGAISLFATVEHFLELNFQDRTDISGKYAVADFDHRYISTEYSGDENPYLVFNDGFEDIDFSWNFAGATASACVEAKVRDGHVSRDQANAMKLDDWARIIQSDWFKSLCNSMALTNSGIYNTFGKELADYWPGTLEKRFSEYARTVDSIVYNGESVLLTDVDGSITLNPVIRSLLRFFMEEPNAEVHGTDRKSGGCPMAQKFGKMPVEAALSSPHVSELLRRGARLSQNKNGVAYIMLDQTPIAATLDLIAHQLIQYQSHHSTPQVAINHLPPKNPEDAKPHIKLRIEHI